MSVSASEQEAMVAVRKLIALGFRGVSVGDPLQPEMLMYGRRRLEFLDAMKVYGPNECEAVRMINGQIVNEISGTVSDVVDVVAGWFALIAVSRVDTRKGDSATE